MLIKQLIRMCFAALLLLPSLGSAEAKGFTVAGEVSFTKTGDIYIELVTKEQFEGEGSSEGEEVSPFGLTLSVGEKEQKAKKVAFEFVNVPAGTYAIQCFQDVNGNGKLDAGKFGPKEPWGMYRPKRPLFRGPKFKEIKFEVNTDMTNIEFEVK